jgi:hypothetical protein
MNSVVGIQVNVQENASTVSPRIVDQLSKIGDAGEDAGERIQHAFEQAQLGNQFDKFTEKIDKLYETKYGKERELKVQNMELRNQTLQKRLDEPGGRTNAGQAGASGALLPGQMVGRIGSGLGQMGSSGNAMPVAEDALSSLSGIVSKAGPFGMVIGGIAALAAGTGMVIDALSKQYEAFVPAIMDTTAAFGDFKDNLYDNTANFRESLNAAAQSANEFGYSVEQGMEIFQGLGRGGMSKEEAKGSSSKIFSYARGFGVGPSELLNPQVLASRYGQENVLGLAAGGIQMSGMSEGRYGEYLQAMVSTFEEGLSKGVVKGFTEISGTMNFFSKLGETWKGQLGTARINQMSSSFSQATDLQKETDVLMYRAARDMMDKKTGGKADYLDVMKEMEKGVTPDLFKAFGTQLQEITGGNRFDMVELMKSSMGTNYTTAIDLVDALSNLSSLTDEEIKAKIAEAPKAKSQEMQLIKAANDLRMQMVTLGENMTEAKGGVLKASGDMLKGIEGWIGADAEGQAKSLDEKKKGVETTKFAQEYGEKFFENYLWGSSSRNAEMLSNTGISPSVYTIMSDKKYIEQQPSTKGFIETISKMSKGATSLLSGKYEKSMAEAISGVGNKNWQLDPEEMSAFLPLFQKIAGSAEMDMFNMYRKVSSTPKIGALAALKPFTELDTAAGASPENLEKMSLKGLLDLQKGISGSKRAFESKEDFQKRVGKGLELEQAITGMSTGQVELLQQTGGFTEMTSKAKKDFWGNLTLEGADNLIKAIKELTVAMMMPVTVTTEDAKK